MKFSWKVLNYFINLESITLKNFIEKLTLAGFEVEEIEKNNQIKDYTINLNITTNRKEIFCIINLAKEIHIILDIPLKTNLQSLKLPKITNKKYNFINKSKQIKYIKIHQIKIPANNVSPKWLKNNLIACSIKPLFLLYDIQQYIKIKWGHQILIYDLDNINTKFINFHLIKIHQTNNSISKEQIIYNNQKLFDLNIIHEKKLFTNNTKRIMLFFFINNTNINNISNIHETFYHAYNETIDLITTYAGATINKAYEQSNTILNKTKKLQISKNQIKLILGPLIKINNPYLSNKNIQKILNVLNLQPYYSYQQKRFEIILPKHREHDLQRNIDIIEEIGRIYGFQYFFDKIPKYKHKGKISLKSFYIKKIRNILLNIGFDEVINSSLINNKININNYILLYNPITEEQKYLRNNISENLINNYKICNKQKNFRIEIFEIGNIFYKNKNNKYIEEIYLGGIINNNQFFKKNWHEKNNKLTWFQAKGILELILYKLQANIKWNLPQQNINNITINNIQYYLDDKEKICIYNKKNNKLIGILGRLHKKYYENNNNNQTYIFEINIKNLIQSIHFNQHIYYKYKKYSLYPSVTRDISININKNNNINEIKNLILQKNPNLIEYIEIVNEYYNQTTKQKSICLRIIYKSSNRTLNYKDLNNINNSIYKLLNITK